MALYQNVDGVIKTLAESGGGLRGVQDYNISVSRYAGQTITLPDGCTVKFMILTSEGVYNATNRLFYMMSGVSSFTLNNGYGTFKVTANGNTISIDKSNGSNLTGKLIVFY